MNALDKYLAGLKRCNVRNNVIERNRCIIQDFLNNAKNNEGQKKFMFVVIDDSGSPNHGFVDSWDEAITALRDWHGAGTLPARSYQIIPVPKNTGMTRIIIDKEDK